MLRPRQMPNAALRLPDLCMLVPVPMGVKRSIMHHTWALLAVTQLNFGAMFGTFGFVQTTPNLVTDFGYPESSANDAFLVIQCYLTVYGECDHPVRLNIVCAN